MNRVHKYGYGNNSSSSGASSSFRFGDMFHWPHKKNPAAAAAAAPTAGRSASPGPSKQQQQQQQQLYHPRPNPSFRSVSPSASPTYRRGGGFVSDLTADDGLVAWNICAGLILLALIAIIVIYIVLVVVHNTEAKAAIKAAIPREADVVQTGSPVMLLLRSSKSATVSFLASTGTGDIASSTMVNDYTAAIRFVPTKQALPGVLSDQDQFKLLFIRDGLWLSGAGKLVADQTQAAAISVSFAAAKSSGGGSGSGSGSGGLIRASDNVLLASAGADPSTDPIAMLLNTNGDKGINIVPFLNGVGC